MKTPLWRLLAKRMAFFVKVFRITDLITNPGLINLDFADVENGNGKQRNALMGISIGSGEERVVEGGT